MIGQWLSQHKPDESVDLSSGLRENWATKKWQNAIKKVQAAQRLAKGGALRKERQAGSGYMTTSGDTTTDEEFVSGDEREEAPSMLSADTIVKGTKDIHM